MKVTYSILVFLFLFVSGNCFSQKKPDAFKAFGIRGYSGELILRGSYRDREISSEKMYEKQRSYYYSGGIMLNASTYIVHPNFCDLQLGAGYMPESNTDNFLMAPDQSEVRTVKKLNVLASFFSKKKVNVITTANYDESYAKRENLTDIKTINQYFGGTVIYSNKYIPVSFDFFKRKLVQTEIQTGRILKMDQIQFSGRAEQSFTMNDKQVLTYSHKKYSNLNENMFFLSNEIDDVNFNSIFSLEKKKIFLFSTTISNVYQHGSDYFNRFQAMENLAIKLPANFLFSTNYNYNSFDQVSSRLTQHTSINSLNHKLFKSLDSRFYFEYNNVRQNFYSEYSSKTGVDFNYTKKIRPGELRLSYSYFRYQQKFTSDSVNLKITAEEYNLKDGNILLLKRPYIQIQSVVVKDITGTIIYQTGIDYFLIEREKYIEIRRVPSGQIPNGGAVYVDYTARQPSSYKYDADNQAFGINVIFFNGKVDVYYRLGFQTYRNLENTDFITLNYYTQNIVGLRLNFGLLGGGVEYEGYKSSILPYQTFRFYINLQKNFRNKLTMTLNGNMQNYTMLNEPIARVQQYIDVAGKLEYVIVKQTKVNLDVMYRKQKGEGIDLDLTTARLELTSIVYQLFVTAGVEIYRRNYIGEKINFKGTYIQISRRF